MSGNTYDWVSTLWGTSLHKPAFRYPYRPDDGRESQTVRGYRVLRGGLHSDLHRYARSSYRYLNSPGMRDRNIGFRVVCGAPLPGSAARATAPAPLSIAGPLQDKVAIVTGAGRGTGQAIALALARAGARVVLVSRTESDLLKLGEEIQELGGSALAAPADVSDEDDLRRVV